MTATSEGQARRLADFLALAERTAREAEANSRFRLGQLVRACESPGLSLVEGAFTPDSHDHNDPNQHFYSRVVGWDGCGRIDVAVGHSNGVDFSWCWSEDMLEERYGPDWADGSRFKPGMTVYSNDGKINHKIEGRIAVAHIQKGDWIVTILRNGQDWTNRVLNESQMHLKCTD